MKKFTQWVDVIREAEERQQSELQKSYKEYFSAKLNKFGAKSPADLDAEQKAEFFNEIKKDWEKGTGAKPAGKKDVEEHGVKESLNEGSQEEQIKKECISKLSDFFGCAPGNLSKFNFDGKDNIKELTKALRSTSDEGTAQYYRVAILMAKRDLGIHESEEVAEALNNYGWFLRLPKKVIANELRSATKNLTSYYNNASSGADLQQDVLEDIISELETVKNQLKKFSKGEKPTGVYESEDLNEAKKQITIKFTKSNQHEVSNCVFGSLKDYADVGNNGPDYMDLKFDAKNYDKVIDTLRRCDAIDSIDESEEFEINEAVATPEELASFIQKEEKHFAAFLKPKKLTATVSGKVVTIKPGSGSFTITVDYAKSTIDTTGKPEWPESTSYVELMEYIKITKFKLNESAIFEAEIKNASDFKEYATTVLKKQHGDKYDEKVGDKIIKGLSDEAEKSGDWGAAVGKLNA